MAVCVQGVVLTRTLVGLLAAAVSASAQDVPVELAAEMRDAGFSDAQITTVKAGGIVTRILPQRDDNAAFVTGVVRIAAPDYALADGVRSIEVFRRGRTLQIGRFGTPPTMEDIQPLVLERRDLDDLRNCRVGDCDVQIGRHAMRAHSRNRLGGRRRSRARRAAHQGDPPRAGEGLPGAGTVGDGHVRQQRPARERGLRVRDGSCGTARAWSGATRPSTGTSSISRTAGRHRTQRISSTGPRKNCAGLW